MRLHVGCVVVLDVGCSHQKTGRPRRVQALAAARPARASSILVCVFRGCSPSNEPPRDHRTDAARPPRGTIPARDGANHSGRAQLVFSSLDSGFPSQAVGAWAARHARRCPRSRERAPRAHSRWAGGARARRARAGTGMRAAGRAGLRLLGQGRGVEADGQRLPAGSASTSGGAASSWLR